MRGGLKKEGPEQLWINWQPAHTRASTHETVDQKNRRRGNAAADTVANDARKLHEDVTNKITRVQWLYHVAKQCATWAGVAAAMQYDGDFEGCDHDVKPKDACRPKRTKAARVEVPPEAKALRKFPWASRSLGTCEYVEDIHCDDPVEDVPRVARLTSAVRAAAKHTMVVLLTVTVSIKRQLARDTWGKGCTLTRSLKSCSLCVKMRLLDTPCMLWVCIRDSTCIVKIVMHTRVRVRSIL